MDSKISVRLFESVGKTLAYRLPEALAKSVGVGSLVKVPLRGKLVCAVVVSLSAANFTGKLREIHAIIGELPVLSAAQIQLVEWMATYYALPLEAVLECFLPAALWELQGKFTHFYGIAAGITEADFRRKFSPRAHQKWAIFNFLCGHSEAPAAEILRSTGANRAALRELEKLQLIRRLPQRCFRQVYADDLGRAECDSQQNGVTLNLSQQHVLERLAEKLDSGKFAPALLHGVTASGKTEIYLQLIENVLRGSGSVLYLVPEFPQTAQAIARVRSRLQSIGIEVRSVVWHSGLSAGERFDAWEQLLQGRARLVVGTRSAVFLPLQNLRLVIIDEEHESAYYQEDFPRYSGRDVAVYRAKLENALCILGSATPSLETYHNAHRGKYEYLLLPERVDGREFPRIRLVDLREEPRDHQLFSERLELAIRKRLERREQVILFLNRRGFNRRICCARCGHVPHCPRCGIALAWHLNPPLCRCHFCNFHREIFRHCPACGSREIYGQGAGTQKLEVLLRQRFPEIRCGRYDSDVFSNRQAFRQILQAFQERQLDLLVGTQMLSKGLDFPHVTLVGIIDADLSLFEPDFRTAERTFQLLTQMAGRSGRREIPGEVILQTRQPDNLAIRAVLNRDENLFYSQELEARRSFGYPPFRRLLRQVFLAESLPALESFCDRWSEFVMPLLPRLPETEMRGPILNERADLKRCFRGQLWFLTPQPVALQRYLRQWRQEFPECSELRHEFFAVDSQNLD